MTTDLRVLFLATAYPAYAADPRGHHVHSLARQVVAAGADVAVIAPTLPGAMATEVLDGVEVHRFRYSPFGREQLAKGVSGIMPNLKAKPHLALQIAPLIVQMNRMAQRMVADFDLIHAHWLYPGGLVGGRVGRRAGIPVVATAHGGDVNAAVGTPGLRTVVKRVANSVDRVLTVSDDLLDKLVSIGVRSSQVEVVPLGVDLSTARRSSEARTVPRVVFVGSLIRRKGVDTLLKALERFPTGSLEVEIIGDGPERDHLEQLAVRVSASVSFRGAVPPEDVAAALEIADLLVLPSRSEGRPVVVMEAMAAGVPVVASDIPGNRELVIHGETGLLFELDDPESLAGALRRAADDSALRQRLGERARTSLKERGLTGTAAAERHLDIYQTVCQDLISQRRPQRGEGIDE